MRMSCDVGDSDDELLCRDSLVGILMNLDNFRYLFLLQSHLPRLLGSLPVNQFYFVREIQHVLHCRSFRPVESSVTKQFEMTGNAKHERQEEIVVPDCDEGRVLHVTRLNGEYVLEGGIVYRYWSPSLYR